MEIDSHIPVVKYKLLFNNVKHIIYQKPIVCI